MSEDWLVAIWVNAVCHRILPGYPETQPSMNASEGDETLFRLNSCVRQSLWESNYNSGQSQVKVACMDRNVRLKNGHGVRVIHGATAFSSSPSSCIVSPSQSTGSSPRIEPASRTISQSAQTGFTTSKVAPSNPVAKGQASRLTRSSSI